MKRIYILLLILIFLATGCSHDAPLPSGDTQQITGTWLCTETGYSIGAGYVTKPVAAFPPQEIIFKTDSTIRSTIEGFNLKFYRLTVDTTYQQKVVTFYDHDPRKKTTNDEIGSSYTYLIDDTGHSLELDFRWCIEGCHLGFRRID